MRQCFALLAALVASQLVLGGPAQARTRPWSAGTADTLPAGRVEFGVFQPLRWGITDAVDLESHIGLFALVPNLTVKLAWLRTPDFSLATEHTLTCPTPGLEMMSREGIGGILPANTRVPVIFTFSEALFVTAEHHPGQLVTGKLGLIIGHGFGRSTLPTIDLPVVYPRTSAWHDHVAINAGLDFDGTLWGPIDYQVDVDLWLLPHPDARAPHPEATIAFEQSTLLVWRATPRISVYLGYKAVWGQYPFGDRWDILPLFDVQFAVDGAKI